MSLVSGAAGVGSGVDWQGSAAAPLQARAAATPVVAPLAGRAAPAPALPAAATPPDPQQQARIAAQQLQEYLRENGHDMKFSIDEASGMTIVRIYNSSTGELVRQIPSEEVVHIAEVLRQEGGRGTLSEMA